MMTKPTILVVLAVLMVGLLAPTACAPSTPGEEGAQGGGTASKAEYEWQYGSFATVGSPAERTSETFCALLNGMSGGRIHIAYNPSAVLGGSEENFDAISTGSLSCGEISPYSGFSMLQNIKGIPYAGSSWEDYDALYYGDGIVNRIIKDSWLANGMVSLFNTEVGPLCYCNSKKPLVTPDDFAGLKFRIPPSDVYVKTFQRMCPKGIGEAIAWGEVFTSLERGVIDGSTMYMGFYVAQYWEVSKYFTTVNQAYIFDCACINKELFDSLPNDLQDLVMECASRAEDYGRFVSRKEYNESIEICRDRGCTVTVLTPEQIQPFIDNVNPPELWEELYAGMLEEYYPGQNMYQQVIEAVEAVS
jgi:TRAP-type C4-dicarboxylate transport system substrate-binding protein